MAANSLLSMALIFGPVGLYPAYLHPTNTLGVLSLVRDNWGLSPANDQTVAGLLMLVVPGGLLYMPATLHALTRWLSGPVTEDGAPGTAGDVAR